MINVIDMSKKPVCRINMSVNNYYVNLFDNLSVMF